jgi:hypothetical protein
MTRPFIPHTLRHGASPPQSAKAPGRSGQGEVPPRPGTSPVWLGVLLLGLWALVAMLMGALPYLTAVAVPETSASATDGADRGAR